MSNFFRNIWHSILAIFHKDKSPEAGPESELPPIMIPMPQDDSEFLDKNIKVTCDKNCTAEEASRLPQIMDSLYEALWHPGFVLFFCDPEQGVDPEQCGGLTPLQVLEDIRTRKIDVVLTYYYQYFSKTIGYRNPGDNIIHCNRKYHNAFTPDDSAENVLHESTHIMGYEHDFYETARRYRSVPYTAGRALAFIHNKEIMIS